MQLKLKPIIAVILVHLCLSMVNYEIKIIPICFLFVHALSMACKWGVQSVALGVLVCCRLWAWLLKYKIYEILCHKERKVEAANAYNVNILKRRRNVS